MKNKTQKIHLIFILSAVLYAIAVTILRSIALFLHFEPGSDYYSNPTLAVAFSALLLLFTVLCLVFSRELREFFVVTAEYRDMPTLFSSAFAAVVMLFLGVSLFLKIDPGVPAASVLAVLSACAALGSTVYFLCRIFTRNTQSVPMAMLALFPSALGILYAFYFYFEREMMINNPHKRLACVSLFLVCFLFLSESRIALGRSRWSLTTCLTLLTMVFCASLSLPNLIYHAVNGEPLLSDTVTDFAFFAFFLFAAARATAVFSAARYERTEEFRYATKDAADAGEGEE